MIRAGPRCDPLGCIAETRDGRLVALVQDRRAFAEDCGRVAVVLSRLTAPASCAAATIIDGAFLRTHGATAIRFTQAGPEIATARTPQETRPWRAAAATARAPPRETSPRLQRPRAAPAEPFELEPLSSDEPN